MSDRREPPEFGPGHAALPPRDYPPTAEFPPVGHSSPPPYDPTSAYPAGEPYHDSYPDGPGAAPAGHPGHGAQPRGGHPRHGAADHRGYGTPPPGYGSADHPGYGTPPPGYGSADHPGYGTPPPGYGSADHPGYGTPPPGYGSADHPGYEAAPPPGGHPGYGPQSPAPGHPAPPRRSNTPLIALILAITLLLCGGVATTGVLLYQRGKEKAQEAVDGFPTALPTVVPTLPSDLPGLPDIPGGQKVTVEYEVSGDGPATIFYTEKLNGLPKTIPDAQLPWRLTLTMQGPSLISVWAVRRSINDGTITCRATVDGRTASEHTASGRIATATCNKLTLN
ncbi:MmpS family transport accessory protein [Actinoplanes teichomyceticus]|uniref:MmpS family membrane protein n=1 Tax=Actinoplanes teichomyceticus TaxID=1867 RepID=A0A561VQH0_ACTTI|nr:MmpS family transport accessory protein [Actinoplanes teichomyceticus]TWG13852.1 MmpS family membrane protein [Actinoplanes teichomyceticus]